MQEWLSQDAAHSTVLTGAASAGCCQSYDTIALIRYFQGSKRDSPDKAGQFILRVQFQDCVKAFESLFVFLQCCIGNSFIVQSLGMVRMNPESLIIGYNGCIVPFKIGKIYSFVIQCISIIRVNLQDCIKTPNGIFILFQVGKSRLLCSGEPVRSLDQSAGHYQNRRLLHHTFSAMQGHVPCYTMHRHYQDRSL